MDYFLVNAGGSRGVGAAEWATQGRRRGVGVEDELQIGLNSEFGVLLSILIFRTKLKRSWAETVKNRIWSGFSRGGWEGWWKENPLHSALIFTVHS